MSEWSKLHARITESEAGAPSFDTAFPEGPSEWDLIGPDGLEYQSLKEDWLLSPNLRAQSGVSSTNGAATEIHVARKVGQDNPDMLFPGPCQPASPSSCADCASRTSPSYSTPPYEAPNARRETIDNVTGRELDEDRIMVGNTNTETASIPASKTITEQVHPQYWAGGRIYWWKKRCAAIATTNDRDWSTDIVSQALKEEWYVGDENGFPIVEVKAK